MHLTKRELRDLTKNGYYLSDRKPNGLIVNHVIVVSHGNRELHDSGYPFIKIFGAVGKELVNLGWHDHYMNNIPTNVDSLGKNIFRIMPRLSRKKWRVPKDFIPVSAFQIGDYEEEEEEFVTLM